MSRGLRRSLFWPLVPVYAGVIATKNWLIDRGILRQKTLTHPVISIGSLSAGGAGKTPVVLMLAELLQRSGFEVRILTRGYRRKGISTVRVDPEGDAAEFGDEPLLIARRLRAASVWVGVDRHRAGRASEHGETKGGKVVYLMDDGFQHRKLARNVDLLLVTREDMDDRLLPAGNLREPLTAECRARIVVVRDDEPEVAAVAGAKPVWAIRRRLEFPSGGARLKRPLVFCGLARPESFLAMLADQSIVPAGVVKFRDHHPYSGEDVGRLIEMARTKKVDGFLTTEKDAVKLSAAVIERFEEVGPVVVPELKLELIDSESKIQELLTLLHADIG